MDTSQKTASVTKPAKRSWRRHSDEFRARVIEMARQPNVSAAAVALANGLNANMLRRWVREFEETATGIARTDVQRGGETVSGFVQLPMTAPPSAAAASPPHVATCVVVVEIQRNGAILRASLPMNSCSAAWLREVTG